ncbi:MAG: hypothetical protein GY716_16250 [bacterium]|nr:hypothetical protein [bacterium]
MPLPSQIPQGLVADAVSLDDEGLAWGRDEAVEILDSLTGTRVAVAEIEVHRQEAWGLVPVGTNWSCALALGELSTAYAKRSRAEAREFLVAQADSAVAFYELIFDELDEAA